MAVRVAPRLGVERSFSMAVVAEGPSDFDYFEAHYKLSRGCLVSCVLFSEIADLIVAYYYHERQARNINR